MTAIIVDDEIKGVQALQYLLKRNCPAVEIVATCNDARLAHTEIIRLKPQLVFMDISMPDKSGLELIRELPGVDFQIIFVTAHIEYSIEAFKFSAIDYLLKPVDEMALTDAVARAESRIRAGLLNKNLETLLHNLQHQKNGSDMKISIPSVRGFQIVLVNDIICCEAENSYTIFHLTGGQKIIASKTLLEYEILLDNRPFLRVHKSYLVNLQHIKEYKHGDGGKIVLSNMLEIAVSRRKKDQVLELLKSMYR